MTNGTGADKDPHQGAGDTSGFLQLLRLAGQAAERAQGTSRTTEGIGVRSFDGPLERLSVPLADPGPGEVTISLVSAGPGSWDLAERSGALTIPLPRLLGWQGAGVVARVGANVSDLKVGDEVVAYLPMFGFYAREATVPRACVARAPRSIPLEDAGALLVSAATAREALVDVAGVSPGQTVLVTAAAGATGMHAVRLAKHLGAHVVGIASERSLDFVRDLGADEAYAYSADAPADAPAAVRSRHPDGVDVLLDNVSPANFALYAPLVRPGGHAVGTHEPHPPAPDGVAGRLITSWTYADRFAEVVDLVDQGVLKASIAERFGWPDANEAHEWLKRSPGRGSILLLPD